MNITENKHKSLYRCLVSAVFSTVLGVLLLTLQGCGEEASGRGLVLPEGNVERGEKLFVQLKCNDCHVIAGRPDLEAAGEPLMSVSIGGKTTRISTYAELVTSVINPSHKISSRFRREPFSVEGVSQMRNYNDVMTISMLNDVVTFLRDQYELVPYAGPSFISYYPRQQKKP